MHRTGASTKFMKKYGGLVVVDPDEPEFRGRIEAFRPSEDETFKGALVAIVKTLSGEEEELSMMNVPELALAADLQGLQTTEKVLQHPTDGDLENAANLWAIVESAEDVDAGPAVSRGREAGTDDEEDSDGGSSSSDGEGGESSGHFGAPWKEVQPPTAASAAAAAAASAAAITTGGGASRSLRRRRGGRSDIGSQI